MEGYPQLLNLSNPKGIVRENNNNNNKRSHEASQDKSLELKLGPPGEDKQPILSLHFISSTNHKNITTYGAKRDFQDTIEAEIGERNWLTNSKGKQDNKLSSFTEEPVHERVSSFKWSCGPTSPFPFSSACQHQTHKQKQSQPCNSRVAEFQCPEKKSCSTPANCPVNTVVPNSSQRRIALRPVVGWPPVRSCRKNISASNSTKLEPESSNKGRKEVAAGGKSEILENSLFVKIKMDGVPIGRKVDLKSYSNYEKLSSAVDELFRGLLAAQENCSPSLNEHMEKTKAITGLLDGSGDYTLVYEDNEGDRMLVGDVPWHMFISSAKRLRVLKKSELSALHLFSNKLAEAPLDSAMKKESCEY